MTQEKNNGLYSGNERGAEIKRDVYKGFTYKILDMGTHPCAYVQIPKDHMLYNVGYDSIRIDVHGGLTYAGLGKGKEEGEYWIGWDYAHLGDYYDHDKITTVSGDKKWTIP